MKPIEIDETLWDAWLKRGRAHDLAVTRNVQRLLCVLVPVFIAWSYFTLSK